MMYSEFIEGTGCRDNEHNYNLFKNLEAMYMNTNLTKDEIYEYGKKLVDNSKSPEQIELEEKLLQEIEECKESIRYIKSRVATLEEFKKEERDENMIKFWKREITSWKKQIKAHRIRIKELKWVLEA